MQVESICWCVCQFAYPKNRTIAKPSTGQDGQVRYEGHMLSEHPEVAVGSPWLKCQVCRHFFRPAEKFEDHPCCRMMYGRGHQTVCINDLELVDDQCHQ
jgi:hypothetical protein